LQEYQNKGFTKFAFHKYVILKEMFLAEQVRHVPKSHHRKEKAGAGLPQFSLNIVLPKKEEFLALSFRVADHSLLYTSRVRTFFAVIVALFLATPGHAQKAVSLPTADGGVVSADLYGAGDHGIVLAHGGRFNKGSWEKQAQALAAAGFRVLAIDFRGYGQSRGPGDSDVMSAPLHLDVLAAVRYLRKTGAKTVAVVGASMGGGAAGDASILSGRGTIDRLVFLGASPNGPAAKLKAPSLFIVARDDANADGLRLPGIRAQYERAPQPKELIILNGSAHAQFLFQTEQGERVMHEILRFLSTK